MGQAQVRLFRRLGPSLTGTAYVNFLDGDEARNGDRVSACYTADDWDRLAAGHEPWAMGRDARRPGRPGLPDASACL